MICPEKTVKKVKQGFSLVEVLVALVIFSSFAIAVFHFYGNAIDLNGRFAEKYTAIRIAKEFVDTFQLEDEKQQGQVKKEGLVINWKLLPVEKQRKLITRDPVATFITLKLVDAAIVVDNTDIVLHSFHFLVNEVSNVRKSE
jgi:type II secretion system protein I